MGIGRFCVLVAIAGLSAAAAQPIDARFTAGATTFADDGPVTHTTVGASVRFYFSKRWSVEPEVLYARHNASFVRDRDTILWGNVAFDILHRHRKVVPYWYAAPGLTRHSSSYGQVKFVSSEAAFGTGLGVRLMLSDRVFVAPQVRLGIADGVFVEVTGSIGFVLKK